MSRAVGLKGEVEIAVESDAPERFATGSVLLNEDDHSALTVERMRSQGLRTIVTFAGVTDRDSAEGLRGTVLVVPIEQARELEEGEYWDHDLIDCIVETTDGERIGTVTDVLHSAANDVLVVRAEAKEHLVPLLKSVVRSVEAGRRITIDPVPGLLD